LLLGLLVLLSVALLSVALLTILLLLLSVSLLAILLVLVLAILLLVAAVLLLTISAAVLAEVARLERRCAGCECGTWCESVGAGDESVWGGASSVLLVDVQVLLGLLRQILVFPAVGSAVGHFERVCGWYVSARVCGISCVDCDQLDVE
jgi:hypothetical protein